MSLRIYTTTFRRQAHFLRRLIESQDTQQFWMGQAKLIVTEVIAHVPPSQGKADLSAKRAGEKTVESDIGKLFQEVAPSRAEETSLKQIHSRHRNHKGRVPRSKGRNKYKVSKTALRTYMREQKARVGYLAAGFNAAANATGYRPPAWIARHRAPGSVSLRVDSRGIRFRAVNEVHYASKVAFIQSRVQKGINIRSQKLWRELEFLMERYAKRSGFKYLH